MQKNQNKAIRISLRLPRYLSIKILHESACLPTIKERLVQQGSSLVNKMRSGNPLVNGLIEKHERSVLNNIIEGRGNVVRSHRSPLDIILPAQRPFLSSTQSQAPFVTYPTKMSLEINKISPASGNYHELFCTIYIDRTQSSWYDWSIKLYYLHRQGCAPFIPGVGQARPMTCAKQFGLKSLPGLVLCGALSDHLVYLHSRYTYTARLTPSQPGDLVY